MKVNELDLADEQTVQRWNGFVEPSGQLYLHTKWAGIISRTYGFTPHYLYISEGDEIRSVFPLFRVVFPLLKDELVSVPHLESGGMLNTGGYQLYFDYIREHIKAGRLSVYQYGEPIDDLEANTNEVVMVQGLPQSVEDIIPGIRSPSSRAKTVKSLKQGFNAAIGNSDDLLRAFYPLFCQKMKEFGTPPHPMAFLKDIARTFADDCVFVLAARGGRYVGGGLYLIFRDRFFSKCFTVSQEELRRYVGNFVDYKSMEFAVRRGLKYLVRWRSTKGSGTFEYKRRLGGDPVPLYLHDFVLTPEGYKARQVKTVKEKYDFAARIWMRLPGFVADTIGPSIRKWVY